MNATLSLPPDTDIDTQMRMVARNLAQGLYELSNILEFCNVPLREFNTWKTHPHFLALLKSEREAWNAASNIAERTKLKAGIAMEEWIADAYGELKDRKQPLNHRVELAKVMSKLAGFDNSGGAVFNGNGSGGGGFSLQINIAPGHATTINARQVQQDIDDAVVEDVPVKRRVIRTDAPALSAIPEEVKEVFEFEDDSALFNSPDTLDGIEA